MMVRSFETHTAHIQTVRLRNNLAFLDNFVNYL